MRYARWRDSFTENGLLHKIIGILFEVSPGYLLRKFQPPLDKGALNEKEG